MYFPRAEPAAYSSQNVLHDSNYSEYAADDVINYHDVNHDIERME